MSQNNDTAPGAPGVNPTWTSSAKSGIIKSLNAFSRVAVTVSHGILNEVYYPDENIACIRDMEFLITNGKDFFSEEKRHSGHKIEYLDEGVPAYRIINTCNQKRYRITKTVIADPVRNSILQRVKFEPLTTEKLKLFAIISPHINNAGRHNNGWVGDYKGMPMLFADKPGIALAIACSTPFLKRSAGYVGSSDGYRDISEHFNMEWQYRNAPDGNIALTAAIDWTQEQEFMFVISFGVNDMQAGQAARASILDGFDISLKQYLKEWSGWQKKILRSPSNKGRTGKHFETSIMVLRQHDSKEYPGGIIASLSFPWGSTKGDNDDGGYHLVWTRDLVEAAGGMIAANSKGDMLRIVNYLMSIQEDDGHWMQNMWLDGSAYWKGIQLDETALPILLLDLCKKYKIFDKERLRRYWPQIRKATIFLIRKNFISDEDRWEESSGLSIFTISTMIAAMLCAGEMAEAYEEKEIANYCHEIADYWNFKIEQSLYVTDTALCKKYNVDGYYIKINPDGRPADSLHDYKIDLLNRPGQQIEIENMVSCDALALVRFGLRAADNPKILNTIKVIDGELKTETKNGPAWHRYTCDGYGENENGEPYDRHRGGIGRSWPLLNGERGHYEIAKGNLETAKKMVAVMDRFSSNGLFPEQVWDADDIPEKELYNGRPSGSAMPLVWAHAEYIKLVRSISDKKVFDMPQHTRNRYVKNQNTPKYYIWRFGTNGEAVPAGTILRIECHAAFRLHYTLNNWKEVHDKESRPTIADMHFAELSLKDIPFKSKINFTFYWPGAGHWENRNFEAIVQ